MDVTVRLSQAPERALELTLRAVAGGGADTDDFTVPATVSFAADQTEATFAVAAAPDDVDDDDGTVTVSFVSLPAGVSTRAPAQTVVTILDDDDPQVEVFFAEGAYSVAEGSSVDVTVRLSQAPERALELTLRAVAGGGADTDDFTVPATVSFAADQTEATFAVAAAPDDVDDDDGTVTVSFVSLPAGVSTRAPAQTVVTILDDDDPQVEVFFAEPTIVVTVTQIREGTVVPEGFSILAGQEIPDTSSFIEGELAWFRLLASTSEGAPPTHGVDVELRFTWSRESPIMPTGGHITRTVYSLPAFGEWVTAVQIRDNDVGNPDGTVRIRITDCKRNGCVIGEPSEITLNIIDDDGGPGMAPPEAPLAPWLGCASTADGYIDTGLAVRWRAPTYVGGAPLDSYDVRYRRRHTDGSSDWGDWLRWPHAGTATETAITGLVAGAQHEVQVRAVNANGESAWSGSRRLNTGNSEVVCNALDLLSD